MKWQLLAVLPALFFARSAMAKTDWAPVGEGRLEIRNADLQSPQAKIPAVAPLRHTEAAIQVRGFVAEVTVTQEFENPLDRAIEAEYVFPLPQDAAVNATEMRIGERVIRGRIDRREAARQAYEQARDQGKRASLLEQERPNIFTQSVANIGPGETVHVVIRYVETLAYRDGHYDVVFPMVVGPRYIPGNATDRSPTGHGREADTDQVPDASRITPPALRPEERCGFDVAVTVDVDAGVPIQELRSKAHRVEIERSGENKALVKLAQDDRIPNKDFVLQIAVAGDQPEIGFLAHHDGKHGYFTLLLQPPKTPDAAEIRPREILMVLDCSGSMSGQPIALAKRAAERLIQTLQPTDYFNVYYFNTSAQSFQPKPVAATPLNRLAGAQFVQSLQANGGTEMLTGVQAALGDPPPEGCLRMIAFLTDGYIGNEQAILREEQRLLGTARLFSFGVGSSVNRYLLDRMAIIGRGTVQYVLLNDHPEEAIDTFATRIARPVLTDVAVHFAGANVSELLPSVVPDVFAGVPVYVHGRYDQPGAASLEVTGRIGTQPSTAKLQVTLPAPDASHSPLPSIWARQRIKQLELDKLAACNARAIEEQITGLALEYSLMSAYTSFAAVDETPSAVANGRSRLVPVAVPVPDGVSYEMTIRESAAGPAPLSTAARGGDRIGGGPVGPFGVAGIAALAIVEWRRRRKGGPCCN